MNNINVSVIIPCYKEEKYISGCLDSLLDNDFDKNLLEIIVVDGMSDDNTRLIVEKYQKDNSFIKLVDNPHIKTSYALNIGIKKSSSSVIMIAGAHTTYPKNYISKLVKGLFEFDVDNIGSLLEPTPDSTLWSKAITLVISHPFGVGNAYHRMKSENNQTRFVKTVFGGCYRREVFEKIGYFNEKLVRTQDRELNLRLVENGGKILLDPSVKCFYFPRNNLKDYSKWNYSGGYWLCLGQKFTTTKVLLLRNLIPLFFVSWHIFYLLALIFFFPLSWIVAIPIIIYWIINLCVSLIISLHNHDIKLFPLMLILFCVTHYGYGLGEVHGFIKALFSD